MAYIISKLKTFIDTSCHKKWIRWIVDIQLTVINTLNNLHCFADWGYDSLIAFARDIS